MSSLTFCSAAVPYYLLSFLCSTYPIFLCTGTCNIKHSKNILVGSHLLLFEHVLLGLFCLTIVDLVGLADLCPLYLQFELPLDDFLHVLVLHLLHQHCLHVVLLRCLLVFQQTGQLLSLLRPIVRICGHHPRVLVHNLLCLVFLHLLLQNTFSVELLLELLLLDVFIIVIALADLLDVLILFLVLFLLLLN